MTGNSTASVAMPKKPLTPPVIPDITLNPIAPGSGSPESSL